MAEANELRNPWLVAVWPGMGNVALGAGSYLVNQLGAEVAAELPARDIFDIEHVEVNDGVASAGRLPRNMFFAWKHPGDGPDVVVFIGEAQPNSGGYDFCHRLLDYAQQWNVSRIFTFAAMATQLHPQSDPRVFAAASDKGGVGELRPLDVEVLGEGQISGLNGVLLAAGKERQIPGACLMGELPFFAVGVPNPKASQAVLEIFTELAGLELDFEELERQGQTMERYLLEMMERLSEGGAAPQSEEGFTIPEFAQFEEEDQEESEQPTQQPKLDLKSRQRVESLFEQARGDRSKAMELKRELDRLGVFKDYEDRFLDLFKRAE